MREREVVLPPARATVPAEPRSPDEAGEATPAAAAYEPGSERAGAQEAERGIGAPPATEPGGVPETPPFIFEEREHTSDASGLAVDDEARAVKRRQQYADGASEVSELD